eukprot:1159172-Pelagomonas_calceolata.AAC.3
MLTHCSLIANTPLKLLASISVSCKLMDVCGEGEAEGSTTLMHKQTRIEELKSETLMRKLVRIKKWSSCAV